MRTEVMEAPCRPLHATPLRAVDELKLALNRPVPLRLKLTLAVFPVPGDPEKGHRHAKRKSDRPTGCVNCQAVELFW
ncbi:MAG TPA: hypothetical protein VM681_05590, partial [Candidatus Thermoplasmatota archaeon]|nr:hypothetical protein [Candidatus Thermoplasmatota archaeon]